MVRTPTMAPAEPVVPSAGWILRQIGAGAAEPLTAAIVGPGGTGKSTLLKAIASAYDAAGIQITRAGPDTDPSALVDGVPVLVDDAQRLAPDTLASLRKHARRDDARMVVAYRPWPRPDGLSALGAQVSRHHSPIVLGHLGRDDVAEQVSRRAGSAPDSLVGLVFEQSGGLPMFVGLVTQAMLDTGRFDPGHPDRFRRPQRVSVSPGLAERLRYLLEALDPGVYRLFEAMALGAPLDEEVLCTLLDTDPDTLADTVEAARATGLVTDAGELIVFVRNLVLRLIPVLRRRGMQRRLAEIQLDNGGPVLAAGRQLAESHATGARAFTVLAAAADEALRTSPHLAVELYDAAVRAGGNVRAMGAQAAALAGDPDRALRLADQILTADSPEPDRRRAVSVSAAVLAQRGFAARAGDLYLRSAGPGSADALVAVPALLACGELERAREVVAAAPPGSADAPTLTAAAVRLLATGMLESVVGDPAVALSQLAQAAGLLESAGDAVLLPYSAVELVAVVSAQCGEPALAEATLGHAVTAQLGGGLTHDRHLLLHGWHALRRGALDTARGVLDRVPGGELHAAALAAGLARQSGDAAALGAAFARARAALIRQPVDLYLVRQIGELSVAAAMLGMRSSVAAHVAAARVLLVRLGNPPLWTAARIPLVAQRVSAELDLPVTVDSDPKAVVAMGAALSLDPAVVVVPEPSAEAVTDRPVRGRRLVSASVALAACVGALIMMAGTVGSDVGQGGGVAAQGDVAAPAAGPGEEPVAEEVVDPWTGEPYTETTPPGPTRPKAKPTEQSPTTLAPAPTTSQNRDALIAGTPPVSVTNPPGSTGGGTTDPTTEPDPTSSEPTTTTTTPPEETTTTPPEETTTPPEETTTTTETQPPPVTEDPVTPPPSEETTTGEVTP